MRCARRCPRAPAPSASRAWPPSAAPSPTCKAGDLVIPLDRDNWVQRKLAKADRVMKVPAGVDPLQLAMLKVNPPTAYLMMTKYVALAPGDWILQTAANSGVGHCLIQLAKAEGFKTVNIVRREGLADELTALGADVVLVDGPDLAKRITAATKGAPIKLAIDAVGGGQIVRFGDALADEAMVVNYGLLSGENPQLSAHQCVFKRITLTGFWLVPWLQRMPRAEIATLYGGLAKHVADGSSAGADPGDISDRGHQAGAGAGERLSPRRQGAGDAERSGRLRHSERTQRTHGPPAHARVRRPRGLAARTRRRHARTGRADLAGGRRSGRYRSGGRRVAAAGRPCASFPICASSCR